MIEIAHRGYSDLHKDNTKESFMSSVFHQFDMIELDIQLTKDDKIIIYHDTFIKNILIKTITYQKLLEIDQDILTLDDFFQIIDISKIKIYLDIKGNDSKISPILYDLIKNNPFSYNIFIASFNLIIIKELYILNPCLQLGFITENLFPNEFFFFMIKEYNIRFIAFHWTMLDTNTIDFLHCNHVMVFTYTSKNKEILSFMENFDIDGIVTNGKLKDYRQGISRKKKTKKNNQKEFIYFFIIILLILFQIKNFLIKE